MHIIVMMGIYVVLSLSLNLIIGYAGLLSIAHAAFFGVGAYVAALMALRFGSPIIVSAFCAAVVACLLGAVVGGLSLRIVDDYFAVATFSCQLAAFYFLNNCVSITGGPMGLSGIPRPALFWLSGSSNLGFVLLIIVLCTLSLWVMRRVVHSPFGRTLKATREDAVLATALGKNVGWFRIRAFMIAAVMASLSGVVYAYYCTFIDPSSFSVMESVFLISIVIIGGAGSVSGSVIGVALLLGLSELLRFIGLPNTVAANVRQILYGVLLLVFVMWRPNGILGEYGLSCEVNPK